MYSSTRNAGSCVSTKACSTRSRPRFHLRKPEAGAYRSTRDGAIAQEGSKDGGGGWSSGESKVENKGKYASRHARKAQERGSKDGAVMRREERRRRKRRRKS